MLSECDLAALYPVTTNSLPLDLLRVLANSAISRFSSLLQPMGQGYPSSKFGVGIKCTKWDRFVMFKPAISTRGPGGFIAWQGCT